MKMYQELLMCSVEQGYEPKAEYGLKFFFTQTENNFLKQIIILQADLIKILDDNVKANFIK